MITVECRDSARSFISLQHEQRRVVKCWLNPCSEPAKSPKGLLQWLCSVLQTLADQFFFSFAIAMLGGGPRAQTSSRNDPFSLSLSLWSIPDSALCDTCDSCPMAKKWPNMQKLFGKERERKGYRARERGLLRNRDGHSNGILRSIHAVGRRTVLLCRSFFLLCAAASSNAVSLPVLS